MSVSGDSPSQLNGSPQRESPLRVAPQRGGIPQGGDSLGLAVLAGGAGGGGSDFREWSETELARDALVQHLKVVLLFAVLVRHLQRFTVQTCHTWIKVAPTHIGVCVANNLLQTGAVEGLAFLSGVAIAGQVLSLRQVIVDPRPTLTARFDPSPNRSYPLQTYPCMQAASSRT